MSLKSIYIPAKLFLIITIIYSFEGCSGTNKSWKTDFKAVASIEIFEDSILKRLQENFNLLIITYNQLSRNPERSPYFKIMAFDNKSWYAIEYHKPTVQMLNHIYTLKYKKYELSFSKSDSVLNIFKKTNFLQIKPKDEGCVESNLQKDKNGKYILCQIADASTPTIIIVQKKWVSRKIYFAPEYWEECCPGNRDRQVFIKCYKAVVSLFL